MKAGVILVIVGILLPTLMIPVIVIDLFVYEYESADLGDFTHTNGTFSYTFKDIGPGELEVDAGIQAILGDMQVVIIYGDSETVAVLDPQHRLALFRDSYYIERTVELKREGDYTIKANYDITTIVLDPYDPGFNIDVTYRGEHNDDVIYGNAGSDTIRGMNSRYSSRGPAAKPGATP